MAKILEDLPTPNQSRQESYLGVIAGQEGAEMPEKPLSREEEYLEYIAEQGGGGGGEPAQYLKTIEKDETNKKVTITDKQGNETEFPYGSSPAYDLITTTDDTITIAPNTSVRHTGTPSAIILTLGTPELAKESEYRLTFVAGTSTSLNVTAPTGYTVVYPDDAPTFIEDKLYEFSFMAISADTISCLYKEV